MCCADGMNENEFYQYLAVFIKTKRKELKYTNEELGYSSKTDVSKVSLLQNNKTGCSAYTLYKILLVLGVNLFDKKKEIDLDKKVIEENIELMEKYLRELKKLI